MQEACPSMYMDTTPTVGVTLLQDFATPNIFLNRGMVEGEEVTGAEVLAAQFYS